MKYTRITKTGRADDEDWLTGWLAHLVNSRAASAMAS